MIAELIEWINIEPARVRLGQSFASSRLKSSNRNCWARRTSSALCASRATYRGRVAVGVTRDLYALSSVFNCILQELHGERGPSGLMTCAAAATGFAVEIFVEQNQIPPVQIGRILADLAVTRTSTTLVRQKDARKPSREFLRHFF